MAPSWAVSRLVPVARPCRDGGERCAGEKLHPHLFALGKIGLAAGQGDPSIRIDVLQQLAGTLRPDYGRGRSALASLQSGAQKVGEACLLVLRRVARLWIWVPRLRYPLSLE